MPKTQIDYSNAYFYKIVCKDLSITDLYVGHTTDFASRTRQHKSACNYAKGLHYNLYIYKFIRDNGGWDNFDMILLDKIPCSDKLEATKIERKYMEDLNATLNKHIPSRNKHGWYIDNKELTKQRAKYHYVNNRESIQEKHKVLSLIHI